MMRTIADLGEIRLIDEVLLPDVSGSDKGDDCALLAVGAERVLWSIDPCPTPVAVLLGDCPPETWGHYTAAINLSDLAASGGTPIGMLVSLELPNDTEVEFVRRFQQGLLETLQRSNAKLLGGNVKSSDRFRATGTVIGIQGSRAVTRVIDAGEVTALVLGECGTFWAATVGERGRWLGDSVADRERLLPALLDPKPLTAIGSALAELPFVVACMDCSDGVGSAVQQLAVASGLDIELDDEPEWAVDESARRVLTRHGVRLENACYHFGDWQLACLVAEANVPALKAALAGTPATVLGRGCRGRGEVRTRDGRRFDNHVMNKNFSGGYNSITSIDELLDRYVRRSVFL